MTQYLHRIISEQQGKHIEWTLYFTNDLSVVHEGKVIQGLDQAELIDALEFYVKDYKNAKAKRLIGGENPVSAGAI